MTTINYIKENSQVNEFVYNFGIIVKRNNKSFAVGFQSSKIFYGDNVEFMPTNIRILNSGVKQTDTITREIRTAISRLSVNYISLYKGTDL